MLFIEGGIEWRRTMFFGVLGWRRSNGAKYIGDGEAGGSIHGGDKVFDFTFGSSVGLWTVGYGHIMSLEGFVVNRKAL